MLYAVSDDSGRCDDSDAAPRKSGLGKSVLPSYIARPICRGQVSSLSKREMVVLLVEISSSDVRAFSLNKPASTLLLQNLPSNTYCSKNVLASLTVNEAKINVLRHLQSNPTLNKIKFTSHVISINGTHTHTY